MLKIISMTSIILLLAGCSNATHIKTNESAAQHLEIKYYTAINELPQPIYKTNTEVYSVVEPLNSNDGKSQTVINLFTVDHAVKCNPNHSECQHSFIKPTLEFTVTKSENNSLIVNGVFVSEAGRETINHDSIGFIKNTLPQEVPVWIEETSKIPFELSTTDGELHVLTANTGNKVTLQVK